MKRATTAPRTTALDQMLDPDAIAERKRRIAAAKEYALDLLGMDDETDFLCAMAHILADPNYKTQSPTPTPNAALPASLDNMIEQRHAELVASAVDEGGYILTGYWNWFNDQIRHAGEMLPAADSPKLVANFAADLNAWKRTRDLFFTAAPIALANLRDLVAEQVRSEFVDVDEVAAADVYSLFKGLTTRNILYHADYAPDQG